MGGGSSPSRPSARTSCFASRAGSFCGRTCECRAAGSCSRAARRARVCPGSCCVASRPRACSGTARCSSCTRGRCSGSVPTSSPTPPQIDAMLAPAAPRRSDTVARRVAARPESGRGHREHVAGRGALARGAVAVAPARRRRRARAARRARHGGTADGARRSSRAREPGRNGLPAAGRPCPRCGGRIRSWGQGDDNRMTYWCPGLSGRRRSAAGVTPLCEPSRATPLRVPARVLPRRLRGRARGAGAVRLRGAPDPRRPVALRVPAARAWLRRGAGADPAPAPRHAQRDRRSAARAGRGDLRARALRHRRSGRRRALPLDPAPDARVDGRALRRVRLAGRRVRGGVPRFRADAVRHVALLRGDRAARRPLGRLRRRARRDPRCARSWRARSRSSGPRRAV